MVFQKLSEFEWRYLYESRMDPDWGKPASIIELLIFICSRGICVFGINTLNYDGFSPNCIPLNPSFFIWKSHIKGFSRKYQSFKTHRQARSSIIEWTIFLYLSLIAVYCMAVIYLFYQKMLKSDSVIKMSHYVL